MKGRTNYVTARIRSFGFAIRGIAVLLATQPNARIHFAASVAVIGLGIWLGITGFEWAVLCLAMGLVWVAEALNTALEFLTDLVSPDYHELAGKAKDVAAGAVLLAAVFAIGVAIAIFAPYLSVYWTPG